MTLGVKDLSTALAATDEAAGLAVVGDSGIRCHLFPVVPRSPEIRGCQGGERLSYNV
ncbi:hypothetical protein ACFLWA_03110 [Chloroflexota bacterium]